MTIFEVFLYDPLYNWSMTPKKALMLQQAEDKETTSSSPVFVSGLNSTIMSETTFDAKEKSSK